MPRTEDYGLASQIRRSAESISANIAEGFGKSSINDKVRFYEIAKSSAFETKSHLIYGQKLDILKTIR
ncbi:four helix bundle protein [Empedobacter falsenii]